jgi:transcriptional regulator of heat shock response
MYINGRIIFVFPVYIGQTKQPGMESKDDLSSVCSQLSTVSFRDQEDVDVDVFIDTAFGELQQAVNNLHSATRNLSMCEDRNDSWEECKNLFDEVQSNVKEGVAVFKEIATVNKQFIVYAKPKRGTKKDAKPNGVLDACG